MSTPRSRAGAATALFVALSALVVTPGHAQKAYPNRPVRLIVPVAPGGGSDSLARLMAGKLSEQWKQQVVVDNRASASGTLAAELVARAPADGYTLMFHNHQLMANTAMNPKLPYHPLTDFAPITQLISSGFVLAVNAASPPRNLRGFIEWTRAYKGPLNYGTAGIGTGGHLAGALYNRMAGVNANHIPYKGTAPALVDLLGGQYQYGFLGLTPSIPLVRAGKLRALGVTSPRRISALPEVPPVADELPGFEVVGWYGIFGPARLPKPMVTMLNAELVKILGEPDVRQRIVSEGAEPVGNTPEQFRQFLTADLGKWTNFVKQTGAKVE